MPLLLCFSLTSPACIRKRNKISIMSFAICSPAGLYQDLHFVEQIEGSVRGMFPRDGKAKKVGRDGEFGELALSS